MRKGYLYGLIGVLLLAGLFSLRSCQDKKIDGDIQRPALAPTDSAKVILDPQRHTITTVTRTGPVKRTYLPPHVISITVGKDGKVTVHARQWGTELAPFVGVSLGSDVRLRAAVGLNLFYIQRWEIGGGLVSTNDVHDIRALVHVSYNPYGNYFVSLGIDHKQTAHLLAGLKF